MASSTFLRMFSLSFVIFLAFFTTTITPKPNTPPGFKSEETDIHRSCDVNLVTIIADVVDTNLDGIFKYLIPMFDDALNETTYLTTLFLTFHVHACNTTQTVRFSDPSKLLWLGFQQVRDANRFNECEPVAPAFAKPAHPYHLQDPKVRIQLMRVPYDSVPDWQTVAQEIVTNDTALLNKTTEILVVVSDYGGPNSTTKPLRVALFRQRRFQTTVSWLEYPNVSDGWQSTAEKVRDEFLKHMDTCRYIRKQEELCSYNAGGQCGRMITVKPTNESNAFYCPIGEDIDPVCDSANRTSTDPCDKACEAQFKPWTPCNASGCANGYRMLTVGGEDRLYKYCPLRVKPLVEKCECDRLAGWEIALIVIFVLIGIGVSAAIAIWFLVIQPRREKEAEELSSASTEEEEEDGGKEAVKSASKKASSVSKKRSVSKKAASSLKKSISSVKKSISSVKKSKK